MELFPLLHLLDSWRYCVGTLVFEKNGAVLIATPLDICPLDGSDSTPFQCHLKKHSTRTVFSAEMDPLKLLPGASSQDDQLAEHMAECLGEGVRALAFQLPILSFSILIVI